MENTPTQDKTQETPSNYFALRLAVNQSVKGSNPFGGATSQLHFILLQR